MVDAARQQALQELAQGKAVTTASATEAVRRLASTRNGRKTQPNAEAVRDIVKVDVGALDDKISAKIDALQAEVNALKIEVPGLQ
jgi:hypothetical protein